MTVVSRVAVVGASGFIGQAVVRALALDGIDAVAVRAPRVEHSGMVDGPSDWLGVYEAQIQEIADQVDDPVDAIINAAGLADATSGRPDALVGANAILPRLCREAARRAGAGRFVHISSAGVQGRMAVLDESARVAPISDYTRSKAIGEAWLADCPETVIYRPTSVHGVGRPVSRQLTRVARSRIASVGGDGAWPTPQVLVDNVASACTFLATTAEPTPSVVLHPWEGMTASSVLEVLGGSPPRHVPEWLARQIVRSAYWGGPRASGWVGRVRRVEMMWFGQDQTESWLSSRWRPVIGLEGWHAIAEWATADIGPSD